MAVSVVMAAAAAVTPVAWHHPFLVVAVAGILLLMVAVAGIMVAVVVQPLVGPLGPVVLSRLVVLEAQAVLAASRAVVVVTLVQILLRSAQGLSRQVAVVRLILPLAGDVLLAVSPVQLLLGGPTVGGRAVPRRPRVPLPPLLLPFKVLLREADVERAAV